VENIEKRVGRMAECVKPKIALKGTTDWNTVIKCPKCKQLLAGHEKLCPKCGVKFVWGGRKP
jgi:hypothetical protein